MPFPTNEVIKSEGDSPYFFKCLWHAWDGVFHEIHDDVSALDCFFLVHEKVNEPEIKSTAHEIVGNFHCKQEVFRFSAR